MVYFVLFLALFLSIIFVVKILFDCIRAIVYSGFRKQSYSVYPIENYIWGAIITALWVWFWYLTH